jgi:hypothetical protein
MLRVRRSFLVILTAVMCDCCLAQTSVQQLATVYVNVESPGTVIPKDFGGLSIEVEDAARKYLGPASSPNLVFYQLLKNLGQGTIRIGGDSGDYSCWDVNSAPQPKDCHFTVTPDAMNGYLKASADTGWAIIFNINLAQNSARWALPYGRAVAKAMAVHPGSRVVFEFGNEPDLYPSENILGNPTADGEKSIRPGTYSWNDLVEEWRSYILAFQRDPITHAIPLVGPAYDSSNDWINLALGAFLDGVGTRNLAMATVHEYPTGTCSPEKAAEVSIPNMLSQRYIESYVYQVLTND